MSRDQISEMFAMCEKVNQIKVCHITFVENEEYETYIAFSTFILKRMNFGPIVRTKYSMVVIDGHGNHNFVPESFR